MRVQQQAANNQLPQPLYEPRSTHTPTRKQTAGGTVLNTSLVVVTAPGKRPATFRTWKLSPAAPMVLQPIGCGRVGHRHNTPYKRVGPGTQTVPGPTFYVYPAIDAHTTRKHSIHAQPLACAANCLSNLLMHWYAPNFSLAFIFVVRALCWF